MIVVQAQVYYLILGVPVESQLSRSDQGDSVSDGFTTGSNASSSIVSENQTQLEEKNKNNTNNDLTISSNDSIDNNSLENSSITDHQVDAIPMISANNYVPVILTHYYTPFNFYLQFDSKE